jgi:hypothetical protein
MRLIIILFIVVKLVTLLVWVEISTTKQNID